VDSATLAERISADWRHIKAVLGRSDDHGQAWLDEIDDAEGGFAVRDGSPLFRFGDAVYARNPDDGSVLVVRDEAGCSVGRTYGVDGTLLAEHAVAGPTQPDMN
jgi:hypothetical protein